MFRENEGFSRNANHALVRAAACGGEHVRQSGVRDVSADDGKVPVLKFKNVGAAPEGGRRRAVCVWVGTEASNEHTAFSL